MGKAANLLSKLLNVFVILPVPRISLIKASELHMALQLAENDNTCSAMCQGFIGSNISGEALLVSNDSCFSDIAKLMKYEGVINDEVEMSLLMDVGSLLIGAFLKGLEDQLEIDFSLGQPVVLGQHRNIADIVKSSTHWEKSLAFEINYTIEDHNIDCDLLLLFTEDSIEHLSERVTLLF